MRLPFRRPRAGSTTAQRVAALRAGFDRPASASGDPDAQRRLARGMTPGDAVKLREHVLARTKFFDQAVVDALSRGVQQVVIVGAGYDDRALRFRTPGVRFFELDQPDTQEDKRRRLDSLGDIARAPTLVPVDFERDSVFELLAIAGQSDKLPTLFLCEGLLVYLRVSDIAALLGGLAARASEGSELAVSLAVHPFGMSSEALVRAINSARGRSADSEPWRTILPAEAHLSLLRQAAWDEVEVLDDADLVRDATPGHSLLVRARPVPSQS
jgi:methyltransferase (TIGR00027 family)